jgi:hypothetical protein
LALLQKEGCGGYMFFIEGTLFRKDLDFVTINSVSRKLLEVVN